MKDSIKFSYDDVLLTPQYSEVSSRSNVDISTEFGTIKLKTPIISSNMDTITDVKMAKKMNTLGGLGLIHRYMSEEKQIKIIKSWPRDGSILGLSLGTITNDKDRIDSTIHHVKNSDINEKDVVLCIDIAHGDSKHMLETIEYVRGLGWNGTLMAGATCTPEGTRRLLSAGADIVRVGVGPGCFSGDTRVLMADGTYKNISDIKLHDKVINMHGKVVDVIGTAFKGYRKVIKYKSSTFYKDTICTSDHLHWVGDLSGREHLVKQKGYLKAIGKGNYGWKEIGSSKPKVLTFPSKINFELSEDFKINLNDFALSRRGFSSGFKDLGTVKSSYGLGYLFGTFLGDGHASITKSKRRDKNGEKTIGNISSHLNWTFGPNELHLAEKVQKYLKEVFATDSKITYPSARSNTHIVLCRRNPLARLFLEFGKKTKKHLPKKYMCLNKEYLQGLFDGLTDSDSHTEKNGRISLTNTSTSIIELHSFLSYSLLGFFPNQRERKKSVGNLKGVLKNVEDFSDVYTSRINTTGNKRIGQEFGVSKILSIKELETLVPVYDIEVDCDTHSFIANNAIVHNSACSTRVKTGCGYPQFSAVLECSEVGPIIADGGIRTPGDAAKALAAGAKAVMIGGMLAGTDCVPGWDIAMQSYFTNIPHSEYTDISRHPNDMPSIQYRGMASSAARAAFGQKPKNAEGISCTVKAKPEGSTELVIVDLDEGIRSAMSYSNSNTLDEFKERAVFQRVSSSVVNENIPHFLNRKDASQNRGI